MKVFATVFGPRQSRQRSPQGFATPKHQTFLLEPILTPSGIIDGVDDAPDVADIPLPDDVIETDIDFDIETDIADTAVTDTEIPETELEDVAFVTELGDDLVISPSFQFESGYFTVGDSGEVTIDYLFDGGKYQGELAIFSLEGMEDLEPGSEAFIQEAANRALSESELGHVVISDKADGARFSGSLGERDWNSGDYRGAQTYQMQAGDRFGVMLVPNGRVEAVADDPGVGGTTTPLFSLATANPDDGLQLGQIADVTGDGNTYVFEDMRVGEKADYDYNDLIFQIRGATGETALVDDLIDPDLEWRDSELGREIVDYAVMAIVPEEIPVEGPEITDQPLVGIIDTGFSGENPDLDYDRIQLGKDWVDGDDNPLLSEGEGNEHGTHVAGLIGATQDNSLGIDGVNDDAPLWFGRAIGSGDWHESLREFVDAAQESEQPNAVVNLSLDLTQVDAEGNVTTRYEFTPQEREAIEYARQNGVLIVAAAGNDGGVMSVLGQASQEFDNILTVGAADGLERADYSSYGRGLGLLATGGTAEQGLLSLTGDGIGTMAGTSVATAQVTGAVSQVWAANPDLSYRQVIEILQETATDLGITGWDAETGAGLLNLAAAIQVAKITQGQTHAPEAWVAPETWRGEGLFTPTDRAAQGGNTIATAPMFSSGEFIDSDTVNENQPAKYYQISVNESGYYKWTISSQEPVAPDSKLPRVSVINADETPGRHNFYEGGAVGVVGITGKVLGDDSPRIVSEDGGVFLDAGTYYVKVEDSAQTTVVDYRLETELIVDQVPAFEGTGRFIQSQSAKAPFVGPTSEALSVADEVTADMSRFTDRLKTYGIEMQQGGDVVLDLQVQDEPVRLAVTKHLSDGSEITVFETEVQEERAPIQLNLLKGQYKVSVTPPMEALFLGDTAVRPFRLEADLEEVVVAPLPGEGQVPANAGAYQETVKSNGVTTHYYDNGYLTIQPNGTENWYVTAKAVGEVVISVRPIADPVVVTDVDSSIATAQDVFAGIDKTLIEKTATSIRSWGRERVVTGSVGGTDVADYYRVDLDERGDIIAHLKNLDAKAGIEVIRDINGNGQIDAGEVIKTRMSRDGQTATPPLWLLDQDPGTYYVRVFTGDPTEETDYQLDLQALNPTYPDWPDSYFRATPLAPSNTLPKPNQSFVSTTQSGSLGGYNQSDYFSFEVMPGDQVAFSVSGLQNFAKLEILADKNGSGSADEGDLVKSSSFSQPSIMLNDNLEPGRYYARLSTFNGGDTDYSIKLFVNKPYIKPINAEYRAVDGQAVGYQGSTVDLGEAQSLQSVTAPTGTSGISVRYDNGAKIYWSEAHGAFAQWEATGSHYSDLGGVDSWLGFPSSREYEWKSGQRVDYEGGYIYWTPWRGAEAYRHGEQPRNAKPTANVRNQTINENDFIWKDFGVYGNERVTPMQGRFGWIDADGDPIQYVAIYDSSPYQKGYFVQEFPQPAYVSLPPGYQKDRVAVVPVDNLNQVYYGAQNDHIGATDQFSIAVYDGFEWSDKTDFNIYVEPGNKAPVANVWNQTINESKFVRKTLSNSIGAESVISMKGRFSWSDPEGQPIQAVAFYDSSPWNSHTGHFAAPDGTTYSVSTGAPNYGSWSKTIVNTQDVDKLYYSNNGNFGITDAVAISVFDGDKWSQPKEFKISVAGNSNNGTGGGSSGDGTSSGSDTDGPIGNVNIGGGVVDDPGVIPPNQPFLDIQDVRAVNVEPGTYDLMSIQITGNSNTSNMKFFLGDYELVKRSFHSPPSTVNQEIRPFIATYKMPGGFPGTDTQYRLTGVAQHESGNVRTFNGPLIQTNGINKFEIYSEQENQCSQEDLHRLRREIGRDAIAELTGLIFSGAIKVSEVLGRAKNLLTALVKDMSDGNLDGDIMYYMDEIYAIDGLSDGISFVKVWQKYEDYKACRQSLGDPVAD